MMKTRYLRLSSLLLVFVLLIGCGQSYMDSNGKKLSTNYVYRTWKISDYKWGDVAAISGDEAQNFINSNVILTEEEVKYFDNNCSEPNYEYKYYDKPNKHLKGFKISKEHLDLDISELHVVEIECKKVVPSIDLMILPNKNRAIISYNGVFFYAQLQPKRGWLDSLW